MSGRSPVVVAVTLEIILLTLYNSRFSDTIASAKVALNLNCYNVYSFGCLPCILSFFLPQILPEHEEEEAEDEAGRHVRQG